MNFSFNADEVFQIAINIEANGKAFYDRAWEMIDDAGVKELFKDLALQEVDHKRRFEKLRAELPQAAAGDTVFDPDNETDQYIRMMANQHVFYSSGELEKRLSRIHGTEEALRLAMEFEKDSVIFFLGMQEATEEAKGKEFIGLLVKEESEHLKRLTLQLRRYLGGKAA